MPADSDARWSERTLAWADEAAALLGPQDADIAPDVKARIRALAPHDSALLHELGLYFAQNHRYERASELIGLAAEASPGEVALWFNHARALGDAGRLADAVASYERAIRLRPDEVVAHFNRAVALHALERSAEAHEGFSRARELNPGHAPTLYNLGAVTATLGRHRDAVDCFDRALRIDPAAAATHAARADALRVLGDLDGAIEGYDRALALDPSFAGAALNRGIALQDAQRLSEAIASYDRALALAPELPGARFAKATALLLGGDYATGFALFESRWAVTGKAAMRRVFAQPEWSGEQPLAGRRVLLYAEQGLGDAIQFCRFAPEIAARGARVFLEVPRPLVALLRSLAGVEQVIGRGDPLPEFDLHCSLMSLPLALGTTLASIPAPRGYLRADPGLVAAAKQRLGARRRARVGIAWSGSLAAASGASRSVPLVQFARLLAADCDYYSLQTEVAPGDTEALAGCPQIREGAGDFASTAALCTQLDLVISVDTSLAHLAGALGVPVWVLLQASPDWRWLLGRADTPWYASARLFRQHRQGDWSGVLAEVAAGLASLRLTGA